LDDLENIVLLCHECHVAAPDTAEPQYMWQWLAAHQRTGCFYWLLQSEIREAIRTYTGPGKEGLKAIASFSDDQLKTILGYLSTGRPNVLLPFSAHWERGAIVSTATWQAVFNDLLRRIEAGNEPTQ
jgi:hypothetical protein